MTTETTLPQFEQGALKKATNGMTSGDLWNCPRPRIHVDPGFNVRIKDEAYAARVRSIADSIKVNGFYKDKPLAGYAALDASGFDIIILTDGHTRLDAVDLAVSEGVEIKDIPMVTKPRGTSMEDLTVALVTGNSGEKLTPFEMATVCKRLVGYGMEVKDIAVRLGYGKAYIEGLLDLLAAPKAVRDLVATGKVSATLAVETVKKHGKEASNVLSAGVDAATASGKGKVTKKHVKAATGAVKPGKNAKALPAQQELPLAGDEGEVLTLVGEVYETVSFPESAAVRWLGNEPAIGTKLYAATNKGDTEAQVAAQKAAFFEKAAGWWAANGYSNVERGVLTIFLADMAELPVGDVEPYFELPASVAGSASATDMQPTESLRQNGEVEEKNPLDEDNEL